MSNTLIFTLLGKDKVTPALGSAGKSAERLGHSFKSAEGNINKSTGRIRGGLANTFKGMKTLVAPALAAFSALGAIGIAKSSLSSYQNAAVEVLKLQRVAGGSAEQMSKLRGAAILSGIGADTLTKGLAKGSKALVNTEGNAKATAKMVALLGFNYQDAHGKVLPWSVLLPKLADKFKSMPAGPQKTALAMKLFGKSGTDMLPFLNRGSAGLADLAKQSDKYGLTLTGKNLKSVIAYRMQQRQFNAQMEGLKITIGKALLPVMLTLMSAVNGFIGQMRSGTGVGGAFVDVMRGIGSVIGAIVPPLKSTVKFLWDFRTPIAIISGIIATVFIPHLVALGIASLVSGTRQVIGWTMARGAAIKTAAVHSWVVLKMVGRWVFLGVQSMVQAVRVAAAWVVAMGPIAWVTIAIVALVALIIWKWKTISTWTTKTFGGMAATVKNFFVGLPGKVGDVAKALLGKGAQLIGGFRTGLVGGWSAVGRWLGGIGRSAVGWVGDVAKALLGKGAQLIGGFRTGLVGGWSAVGKWLGGIGRSAVGWVGDVAKSLASKGVQLISGMFTGISTRWGQVGKWLTGLGKSAVGWVGDVTKSLVGKGVQLISGMFTGISTRWGQVGRWIGGIGKSAFNWLGNVARTLTSKGVQLISGMFTGISDRWSQVGRWISGLRRSASDWLGNVTRTLYTKGQQLLSGMWNGLGAKWPQIGRWIGGLPRSAVNYIGTVTRTLYTKGQQLLSGMWNGLGQKWSQVGRWIGSLRGSTLAWLGNTGLWLVSRGKQVLGGFWNGLGQKWHDVQVWVGGIAKWIRDHKGPISLDARLLIPAGRAIMDGFLNGLKSGAGAAWSFVQKVGGKTVNALRSAMGLVGGAVGGIRGAIGNLFGGYGGGGVERWRGTALSALHAAGAPASWIGSLLRRMNQESGGNPRAINLTDSNARAGHPSQGLMQTIPGTFNAYAGRYRSRGITDPFANIYAAIRYTIARYGSGPAGWNRPGGYRDGGWLLPGRLAYNETSKPEAVFNQRQLAALVGGGRGGEIHIHLDGAIIANRQQALDWLTAGIDKLKQQGRI